MSENKLVDLWLSEYSEKCTKLWDILMGLELQLVDQLEVGKRCMIQWECSTYSVMFNIQCDV